MAYLLRVLILLMLCSVGLTISVAKGFVQTPYSHIEIAIPTFIYVIFAQAFVMFYFIGCSRLVTNVYQVLINGGENLKELFEVPPTDIDPYMKKTRKMYDQAQRSKRQTIPWTMLMLVLGTIGFLLGGAHDTNMVSKIVHSGVIYGFSAAMIIGFARQWYYLGKSHKLLRDIKALYEIPDAAM